MKSTSFCYTDAKGALEMEHRETVKVVPGADKAVLFIHGIAGTPEHFRKVLPLEKLVPEGWSVYNLRLDGHGGSVSDFSRTSMKKWKRQTGQVFEDLVKTHEKILIVGHSMGCLFAIDLAVSCPGSVESLFLLAVPMRPGMKLSGIGNMLRLVFGRIRPDRPVERALQQACGVEPTWKIWKYLGWIPRFVELFLKIWETEKNLTGMKTPSVAFQSGKDELVRLSSSRVLNRCSAIEVRELEDSGHFYYAPGDRETLIREFEKVMKKHA